MPSETTALFIEHRRSLVDYAARILGSRAQAEDVVQEAYIQFSAANGKAELRDEPILQPLAYLYAIVRNRSIHWARRSSLETAVPADEELAAFASDAPSAETVLVHRDELRTLVSALGELPERTRLAFQLHRVEGLPLREVADRLGISISRAHQLVKTAMVHGARRLRDRQP